MKFVVKEGDQILTSKGSSFVTKINEKSIWLDGKRYGLEAVLRDVKSIIHAISSDEEIDWTNKDAVSKFYNSFHRWSFYISGGCKYTTELCEVKDGMLCHNGEYYVPAPKGTMEDWCGKDNITIEDGLYYVRLYKRVSGYYSTMGGHIRNVFYVQEATSQKEQESLKVRKEWDYYNTPIKTTIEHLKKINLQKLLGKELEFIKHNVSLLFEEHLPYKASNGVYINKWESFKNPLDCTKGLLYIENSYRGNNPSGLDYGLMFKYHPSFSNEHQYHCETSITSISPVALEQIAVEIRKVIEKYATNFLK